MSIILRPYQQTFVTDLRDALMKHRRVLGVAPTGSGKTVSFAYIASRAAERGRRIVIAAHRTEIVDQISAALTRFNVDHGRIQAGHPMSGHPVRVGMIQTIARRLDNIEAPDLLVLDEAHHAPAGQWQQVMNAWRQSLVLGFTATPIRLDGRGLGDAFDEIVLGPTVAELIAGGNLARFTYLAPPQAVNLTRVHVRAGDFANDELADVMDRPEITGDAIQHYQKYLPGKSAVVFCVSVSHAEHVAAQFNAAGIAAASVDGKLDPVTRRDRIAAIGDGRLQILTSCEIISEGTDLPEVAGCLLLRPTQSLALHLQQVGRVLRPKVDGGEAVILDHVGNVRRHGLPDSAREWSLDAPRRRPGAHPGLVTCERCYRAFITEPGWKAASICNHGQPIECILAAPPPDAIVVPRELPPEVDGELAVVDAERLNALRSASLKDLIAKARTRAELKEIADARGYRPGWIWHTLQEIRSKKTGTDQPTNG